MGNWFQSSSLEPSPLLKQHGPRGMGGWAVCRVYGALVTHTHLRVFVGKGCRLEPHMKRSYRWLLQMSRSYVVDLDVLILFDIGIHNFISLGYTCLLKLISWNLHTICSSSLIVHANIFGYFLQQISHFSKFQNEKGEALEKLLWEVHSAGVPPNRGSLWGRCLCVASRRVEMTRVRPWGGWGLSHWSGQINSDLISRKSPKK